MKKNGGRQAALDFLHVLREDPAGRNRVADRIDELSPEDIVDMGMSIGRYFDTEDLNWAFRQDWILRRLHFHSIKGPTK